MFSAYFVFHCLNMFCVEKQISKFFAIQLATRQSRNAQNQLFKELFRGKPVLNLSHPLINPSFNIFTSKPNQFEWFFIPLTSLR